MGLARVLADADTGYGNALTVHFVVRACRGIYDRSRQLEICLRNSVKRTQKEKIDCKRFR
jgi:hypothetical protein